VFLSQIDWLWNKILWQFFVYFRHPWRIKKTDFTRQVITRTLSKINERNSVCERMLVDSTYWVGRLTALILLLKKNSPKIYGLHWVWSPCDKWVPFTTSWHVLRLRMEERPLMWWGGGIGANLFNESRTAVKGWSFSLGIWLGANNSSPWKRTFPTKYSPTKPRTCTNSLVRPKQRKRDWNLEC
jgi:hypothetical protein